VIDPKINIRSKPIHSAQQESLIKGNAAIARADAAVQTRAYELYELRGRTDGRAEEDWYHAEADLRQAQTRREGRKL
jgi:sarcosine oxidase delta subunit